jgi:lipopolysaccharide export system permease protein
MKLLDRYLLRELVGPFLFGVGVVLMLFEGSVIFQVLNTLDQRVSLWGLARVLLFKVPYLLVWSAPVATLFASAFAINRLGRDNEITCIRGAGVSVRRICLPIATVGLLVSIAAFIANERLVPWAERQANATMRRMAIAQAIPQIQPNVFFNSEDYWFYIGSVQKIGTRDVAVEKVLIYHLPQDDSLPELITAKRGRSRGLVWEFDDGWKVVFDRDGSISTQFRFQKEPLELNLEHAVQDFWVNQRTAQEMTLSELRRQMDQLGGMSSYSSSAIRDFALDYHLRFSIPLSCLIFALLAAPLALRFARGGSFWGILLSIVLGFVYYNIIFFAKVVGSNGAIPPVVAGWSQTVIFGVLAVVLILREE